MRKLNMLNYPNNLHKWILEQKEKELEAYEQMLLVEYLEDKGLKFTAIPNSTFTKSYMQQMKNKATGLRPGLCDILVLVPTATQGICTIWIELKRKRKILNNGKLGASPSTTSEQQIEWIQELNKCESTEARICFGAEESIAYIEELEKV